MWYRFFLILVLLWSMGCQTGRDLPPSTLTQDKPLTKTEQSANFRQLSQCALSHVNSSTDINAYDLHDKPAMVNRVRKVHHYCNAKKSDMHLVMPLGGTWIEATTLIMIDKDGRAFLAKLDPQINLNANKEYFLRYKLVDGDAFVGFTKKLPRRLDTANKLEPLPRAGPPLAFVDWCSAIANSHASEVSFRLKAGLAPAAFINVTLTEIPAHSKVLVEVKEKLNTDVNFYLKRRMTGLSALTLEYNLTREKFTSWLQHEWPLQKKQMLASGQKIDLETPILHAPAWGEMRISAGNLLQNYNHMRTCQGLFPEIDAELAKAPAWLKRSHETPVSESQYVDNALIRQHRGLLATAIGKNKRR